MAAAGVASRRACEDLIASGEVTVNGQPVTEQGTLVRPGTDQISVKGKPLATSHIGEKYYYFAVNKPKPLRTTFSIVGRLHCGCVKHEATNYETMQSVVLNPPLRNAPPESAKPCTQ
eukprot:scaffold21660_cov18-Tisochrysis_lutea.AAC.2